MIAPLLRAAATFSAARSLRAAADHAINRVLLTLGIGVALVVSSACFTFAAFVVLERQLDWVDPLAADETAQCIPMLDPEQGRRGPRA